MRSEGRVSDHTSWYGLRLLGDPVLSTPTRRIESAADIPPGLLDAMHRICREHRGLGLAAPQAGASVAIALVTIAGALRTLINPEIKVSHAHATEWGEEGCLSIPGFFTSVRRYRAVIVRYRDEHWVLQHLSLDGMEARCVQHECDHLAGKLITDDLPRQQRRRAERFASDWSHRHGGPSLDTDRHPVGNGGYRRTAPPAP